MILIAHSLGGVLVETYMRLYDDWQEDISKFIALAVPFDGSNAFILQSQILGHNMNIPIPFSILKQIQLGCGSTSYMMNKPSHHLHNLTSKIFVKIRLETQQSSSQQFSTQNWVVFSL